MTDCSHDDHPDATELFLAHRNLLFTAAYELLGSAADAEDVLQETWLRWVDVDLDTVRDPRAYLVRITTRQALGRLRTLSRRRESYVGPWLPEPLLTAPDVADFDCAPDSCPRLDFWAWLVGARVSARVRGTGQAWWTFSPVSPVSPLLGFGMR